MGKLEKEAKKERLWRYVQDAVLQTVAIAGVLALVAVAPAALQIIGQATHKRNRFNYQVKTSLSRLHEKGYITFSEEEGKKRVRITDRGRQALEWQQEKAALNARKKKRWDKRWRMVIFDIPERRRHIRDRLRSIMQGAGFLCLQQSVWVFPYECEELVALLKADLRIGKDVLYVIVEKIEYDAPLKKHFGLR